MAVHPQFPTRSCRLKDALEALKNLRPQRGGIIPFFHDARTGRTSYCMGDDATFHELTDFGGGIKYKLDQTVYGGALRELHEETLCVFQNLIDVDNLLNCHCIFNRHMFILFVPLKQGVSLASISREFEFAVECARQAGRRIEISKLVWIDERSWASYTTPSSCDLGAHGIMYGKVQALLRSAPSN